MWCALAWLKAIVFEWWQLPLQYLSFLQTWSWMCYYICLGQLNLKRITKPVQEILWAYKGKQNWACICEHAFLKFPSGFLHVSWMFPICFMNVSCRFPVCFLQVFSMFSAGCLHVSWKFPVCFLHVSCKFPAGAGFLYVPWRFPAGKKTEDQNNNLKNICAAPSRTIWILKHMLLKL